MTEINQRTNQRPLKELLAGIDDDMSRQTPFAPPVRRAERTPEELHRVADLTGDVLRKSAEDATKAVMQSVIEAETKVAALRQKAEHAMTQLQEWTEDFARQNTELIEKCISLEASINETVQHIIQIGQKPLKENERE